MCYRVQNQRERQREGPEEGADTAEPCMAARGSITLTILAPGRGQTDAQYKIVLPQLSHPVLEMHTYEHGESRGGREHHLFHHLRVGPPSPGEECFSSDRSRLCSRPSWGHPQELLMMTRQPDRYVSLFATGLIWKWTITEMDLIGCGETSRKTEWLVLGIRALCVPRASTGS